MKRRHSGVTLVSLLVGLVISLVVVLAMLGTYKAVVRSAFGTGPGTGTGLVPNARLDGQLTSGMHTVQLALQDAGFGIPGASPGTEFIVLSGATLSASTGRVSGTAAAVLPTGTAGNAWLWISNPALSTDSTKFTCHALLWTPNAAGTSGSLQLLTADGACAPLDTSWPNLSWGAQTLVAEEVGPASMAMNASSVESCWPYGSVPKDISGSEPPAAKLQTSLSFRYSTVGTGSSGTPGTLTTCLTNFQS